MGWKSTETITRSQALYLLQNYLASATNEQLADAMDAFGFGDDTKLPYFGHNFNVVDKIQNEDDE